MNDNNQNFTNCLIRCLIGAMITLVLIVAAISVVNGVRLNRTEKLLIDNHELTYDDSHNVFVSIPVEDFEGMIKMKGIESNDYLTIILTLITLCATLSAVIPYIVGKSVTENQVRETVEKCLDSQTKENDRRQRETIEQLESAEAHLSRMISYQLLYDVKDTYTQSKSDNFDARVHPFWALGWASKSMIRYIKVPPKFHNQKFVDYTIQYMLLAGNMISEIKITDKIKKDESLDFKGKTIRAFVDLFDALGYYYSYSYNDKLNLKVTNDDQAELNKLLRQLYKIIKEKLKAEKDLENAIIKKSKYKFYLAKDSEGNVTEDKIKDYLADWINNKNKEFSKAYYR